MKELVLLLKKDLKIEFRTKEVLILQITMALLLSTVCAVGIEGAFLSAANLTSVFPTLLWIVFLFSATLAVSRSYEYEFNNDAIYGLLSTGVSPAAIFLSKLIGNTVIAIIGQFLVLLTLAALTNVVISPYLLELLIITFLVAIGFAATSTLLIPMTVASRLKSMLLPLILLPLLFPILFAGLELTANLFDKGTFDLGSIWVSLALGFDVIYVVLGINLFEKVILE